MFVLLGGGARFSSLVIHNDHKIILGDMARLAVNRMVYSPVSSKYGIELSLDTSLNNRPCLNILRPGVLRQYFGRNLTEYLGQNSSESNRNETIVKICTYASGNGTSSVGMDPYNFVTQNMSGTMELWYMSYIVL